MISKDLMIAGLGSVRYEEGYWSGKQRIFINGIEAQRIKRNRFMYEGTEMRIKGSFIYGARIIYNGGEYTLFEKPAWYELVLAALPMFTFMTWGGSVHLNTILPMFGGVVGGALGGASMVLQLTVSRIFEKSLAKIGISLAIALSAIGINSIAAIITVAALA